jgi:hypothetical protein
MKENSHIDKNTFDYLKPDKPKVGRFYLLPKIHKVNNTGRPVPLICKKCSPLNVKLLCFSTNVSNWTRHSVGGSFTALWYPTEKISEFVDFHLRPHVEALPSHLKDTTDYLQKMESLNPLPSGTILVSMDVTSFFTNIPIIESVLVDMTIFFHNF